MFGPEGGQYVDGDVKGLIPRSVEYIFKCITERSAQYELAMVCSFLEIYNDQIRDLGKAYLVAMGVESSTSSALYEKTSDLFNNLSGKRGDPNFTPAFRKTETEEIMKRPGLKEVAEQYKLMNYDIREDTEGNVFVKDLSLIPVTSLDEVMTLIAMGLKVRATHETKMNATSSRSHTIFALTVIQRDKSTGQAFTGVLNLVDLAGSERIKKSESQGIRLREALHINTSLTALGKVIMSLDPSSEMTHIPYRDSKLTRILQNSLGGNSYTTVVAAIHPNVSYYDECLSTLQFANRCRNVMNTPKVNYVSDNEDKDRKIRRLLDEVQQMRLKLGQVGDISGAGGLAGANAGGKGEISPTKLAAILQKLGIKAEVTSDGVLVVDGKKVAPGLLGLDSSESISEDSQADPGGGGISRAGNRGGGEKTKKMLEEAQEQLKNLHESNRDRKEVMDKQASSIKKLSTDLIRYQTGLKHKEHLYDQLSIEKERLLKEQEERLNTNFEARIKELMNQNQVLLTQQHGTLQQMPVALKEYTELLKKLKEDYEKDNEPLILEHKRQLASLECSLKDQMESMKQQYEHWLEQKDQALKTYVAKFNEYKLKKHDQLHKCELEVVRLHDHVEKVEAILAGFEKGEYPVVQRQGFYGKPTTGVILSLDEGLPTLQGNRKATVPERARTAGHGSGYLGHTKAGSIVIPKGLRPTNPLVPDKKTGETSLAKKIVKKYRDQDALVASEKNRSMQQAQLLTSMGLLDPEIQKQIQDMISVATPKNVSINRGRTRTESSGGIRGVGSDVLNPEALNEFSGRVYPATAPTHLIDSGAQSMQYNELGTSDPNEEIRQLRDEVASLKAEKRQTKLENEKIVKALSGNDTMQYIRQLETEQDKLHNYIRDIASQLKSSKVANASLTRQLEKVGAN